MTKREVIKRADQINEMLDKLKEKAKALADKISEEGYDYNPQFRDLRDTLYSLVGFDLEDLIWCADIVNKEVLK